MELFERINIIASKFGNKSKIAQVMGITSQKYSAWSNATSQRNFWELLPKILQAFPDVSREWLYFEEGEMFRRDNRQAETFPGASADNGAILHKQAETIRTLTEINRRLTEELITIRREPK